MTTTSTSKLFSPRPWHTAAFYHARIALVVSGMVCCFLLSHHGMLLMGWQMSLLLALDSIALFQRRRGKVTLPAPLVDSAPGSYEQERWLRWTIVGFGAGLLLLMSVAFYLVNSLRGTTLVWGFVLLVLVNVCGWNLLSWSNTMRDCFGAYRKRSKAPAFLSASARMAQTPAWMQRAGKIRNI